MIHRGRFGILLFACLACLNGCASPPSGISQGTVTSTAGGALLGGLAGAVIGNQTGSPLAGAAIGAGIGGVAGAALAPPGPSSAPYPPSCPAGYTCYPTTPQPACPAGYTCVPNAQ
ncbi:YMGG-like glycine zipper-containing protein [Acidithiobacillus sp.]